MRVKLLEDIVRNGRVKIVAKRGRRPVVFHRDTVIEVSDATGKKWIEQGKAKKYA
jgi:hypothetical protein